MRIATRLSLLFVALTFVVALSVGWFAVAMSSRARYATLDSSINAVVDSGLRDHDTALSNALYVAQYNDYDLSLIVVFPSGATTAVATPRVPLRKSPTLDDVHNSLRRVVTEANLPGFRVRSLNIGGGDYLVVAASTAGISSANQHFAWLVALAAVVVALLGFVLARLVMRRDLRSMERLIDYAGEVAGGEQRGPAPSAEGGKDLQELRGALVVMVDALQERIDFEARSAQAMQEFIDDASHELRTPLTVVKGYNDMMLSDQLGPEQRLRALERTRREIERMETLVRDLLLIAQVREMPEHDGQPVALSDLLDARALEFKTDHPSHPLTTEVEPNVVVAARPELVERLVSNALTNVVRHTPSNAPVAIGLHVIGENAVLVVEDGGPGLPRYGERPQRFQRFDESRSRETGGSGLGMSIMFDVAEALGGTLTTEPSRLGGLALRIVLPLVGAKT